MKLQPEALKIRPVAVILSINPEREALDGFPVAA